MSRQLPAPARGVDQSTVAANASDAPNVAAVVVWNDCRYSCTPTLAGGSRNDALLRPLPGSRAIVHATTGSMSTVKPSPGTGTGAAAGAVAMASRVHAAGCWSRAPWGGHGGVE